MAHSAESVESRGFSRREFIKSSAGAAALALTSGCASRGGSPGDVATAKRPNLVYVFADQLRYQSCGYAGDQLATTPNMDRLAAQGCNFRQAVSSTPVCAPYRASLFTGKYQSSTGMVINELRLSPEHECFGHVLARAGYQQAFIGKWHLWANQLGHHGETINAHIPKGRYRLGFDGLWAAYNFNHTYNRAPYFRDTPQRGFYAQFEPDAQTDLALDFIRKSAGGSAPFSLFLSWGPPHDPMEWNNCSERFAEKYRGKEIPLPPNFSATNDPYGDAWARIGPQYGQRVREMLRVYHAQNANLDYQLGRIMRLLEELGIAENTILVFTSDHGEMFGAHGRKAKLIFYEEAVRVPFLMQWKGHIPAGKTSDACLGTPDVMPTLLSTMNLPIPRAVEGMSLSHLALGKEGAQPEAAYLQGMGAVADWTEDVEWRGLRNQQYTYGIYRRDGNELLFDNVADPYQMKNLAKETSSATVLRDCREKLRAWMKEQNDTFEKSTWYRQHWTDGSRNILQGAKGGNHDLARLRGILSDSFGEEGAEAAFAPRDT